MAKKDTAPDAAAATKAAVAPKAAATRKTPAASRTAGEGDGGAASINGIVQITSLALQDAPAWLKGFVFIAGIIALIAVASSGALIYKEQYGDGTAIIIVTIVAVLLVGVGIFFAVRHAVPLGAQEALVGPKQPPLKIKWSRPMLALPINDDDLRDLSRYTKAIHSEAFQFLSSSFADVKAEYIRVNVFFADYRAGSEGEICKLVMTPHLCEGMVGCPDEDIEFSTNQGVAGRVYRDGREQLVARVQDSAAKNQDFSDVYELSADQKKMIHPDLKWIVSTPLNVKIGGSSRAIGVLNVDGLFQQEVDVQTLRLLAARILKIAVDLADGIAKLPMVTGLAGIREVQIG